MKARTVAKRVRGLACWSCGQACSGCGCTVQRLPVVVGSRTRKAWRSNVSRWACGPQTSVLFVRM